MRSRHLVVLLALALGGWIPAGPGQEPASIAGVVRDSSGGVLPGVTLTLAVAGREFKVVTAVDGSYAFLAVPSGPATLTAVLAGFRPLAKGLEPESGRRIVLDLTLCPAALAEIDWIGPPHSLSELFAAANTVAYVRVVSNEQWAAECEQAGFGVTAKVAEWLKPANAHDATLTFWQEQWNEEREPYAVGTEMVVFLTAGRNRLERSFGPFSVFQVRDGKIVASPFLVPDYRRYVGVPLDDFLRAARTGDNAPAPRQRGPE